MKKCKIPSCANYIPNTKVSGLCKRHEKKFNYIKSNDSDTLPQRTFKEVVNSVEPHDKRYYELQFNIGDTIHNIMLKKKIKWIAGFKPHELDKILAGDYNLTLKEIAYIEVYLDEKII